MMKLKKLKDIKKCPNCNEETGEIIECAGCNEEIMVLYPSPRRAW